MSVFFWRGDRCRFDSADLSILMSCMLLCCKSAGAEAEPSQAAHTLYQTPSDHFPFKSLMFHQNILVWFIISALLLWSSFVWVRCSCAASWLWSHLAVPLKARGILVVVGCASREGTRPPRQLCKWSTVFLGQGVCCNNISTASMFCFD